MAKIVDVKVVGLKELERLLAKELPATVARRLLLGSLRKAGEPTVNYAKATAKGVTGQRRSGALAASIGMITSRLGAGTHHQLNRRVAAAVAIGPLSGQGSRPLLAYAMYRAYYHKGVINIKRGAPIGRIRHGHLVEFGFRHVRSGQKIKGTRFLQRAGETMLPIGGSIFKRDLQKRIQRAIRRHNARSPARVR